MIRLAERLRSGEVCFTVKLNLSDPQVCEIAAMSGADAVWLDREHCVGDWAGLYHQILATNRRNADVVVRVPRGSYSDIAKPYEMGAGAVMVPQVNSLSDAAEVVRQAKFAPVGLRALDGGNSDGDFGGMSVDDYLAASARDTVLILQLESPEAVAQADDIAALPGVDVVFFGPGDYSQAAGITGRLADPQVKQAQRAVAEAARRAGIVAGTVMHADTSVEELVGQGYRLINAGADVGELRRAFRGRVTDLRSRLRGTQDDAVQELTLTQ